MPNPTATIYPPYHAIDDLIQRGTRAAQPAASAVTPGTLYGVTDEGNAVERSNGTAWQAYSPTGGGGGAPAAHHLTHEPGGSDPLTVDAVAATGSLRTLGTGAQQAAPGNDARFTTPATPAAHHVSHETGGTDALAALSASILTSGTVADARLSANVALRDNKNYFSDDQFIQKPGASVRMIDTTGAANQRLWVMGCDIAPDFYVQSRTDAGAITANAAIFRRTGDVHIGKDVYEKGRTTPMGHWQTGDVSSYVPAVGLSGPIWWSVVGKTLCLLFTANGVLPSGLASIPLTIPGGYSTSLVFVGAGLMCATPTKTWHPGVLSTSSAFTIDLYDELAAAWSAGQTYINGTVMIAIT